VINVILMYAINVIIKYYKIDSQEDNDDEDDKDNDNDNDDNSFDKGVNKVLKTYKAVGKVINEIDECANQ